MARILYSDPISEIKGSIGGVSFHRNNSGCICKLKPSPRVTLSPYQSYSNYKISYFSSRWQMLTIGQKEDWNAYAALHTKYNYWGEEKTLTGYNFYMMSNINSFNIGGGLITNPPVYVAPLAVHAFTIVIGVASLNVNFGEEWDFTGYSLIVFSSPLLRCVSNKQRNNLYLTRVYHTSPIQLLSIKANWSSIFGVTWPPNGSDFSIVVAVATVNDTTGLSSQFATNIGTYT
jgi:hypothetical protein